MPEQAPEKSADAPAEPSVQTETVEMPDGTVEFIVGGLEDDFGLAGDDDENFTTGPADDPLADQQPKEPNPSEPSSPSKNSSPAPSGVDEPRAESVTDPKTPAAQPEKKGRDTGRPSVCAELNEIRQEQKQKAERKKQERGNTAPQRTRKKSKKKPKGR